jgi:hypothetical protein
MGLNDEREKLRQAEEFLMKYRPDTQEFEAALEHVRWAFRNTNLRDACKAVIARVAKARGDERNVVRKLTGEHVW